MCHLTGQWSSQIIQFQSFLWWTPLVLYLYVSIKDIGSKIDNEERRAESKK